jgi:hypothetical protein
MLFAGRPDDVVWFNDLRWADTAQEAFRLIRDEDRSALIAEDGWETKVTEILGLLGCDEDHIDWAIRTAPRVNE